MCVCVCVCVRERERERVRERERGEGLRWERVISLHPVQFASAGDLFWPNCKSIGSILCNVVRTPEASRNHCSTCHMSFHGKYVGDMLLVPRRWGGGGLQVVACTQ